jgi:hypothetical protein
VRHLDKCLDFRDVSAGVVTSTQWLTGHPGSLSFVPVGPSGRPVVAVAEHNRLSIWDPRVSEAGGCVARDVVLGGQRLWSLAAVEGGSEVMATGEERTIFVYDVRTTKVRTWLVSFSLGEACGST